MQTTAFANFHVCENQKTDETTSHHEHLMHVMDVDAPISQVDHADTCQCDSACAAVSSTLVPNLIEFAVTLSSSSERILYQSRFVDSTYSVALRPPKTA